MAICSCGAQFNPDFGQCMACAKDPAVKHDQDEEQANREDALLPPDPALRRIMGAVKPYIHKIAVLQQRIDELEKQVADHKRQELLIQQIGQSVA